MFVPEAVGAHGRQPNVRVRAVAVRSTSTALRPTVSALERVQFEIMIDISSVARPTWSTPKPLGWPVCRFYRWWAFVLFLLFLSQSQ
jgi:hypothetical protein